MTQETTMETTTKTEETTAQWTEEEQKKVTKIVAESADVFGLCDTIAWAETDRQTLLHPTMLFADNGVQNRLTIWERTFNTCLRVFKMHPTSLP